MQGIYTHIPETNYVPREHGVAAVLLFLFMVLISLLAVLNLLYFYISTFRRMCAVPSMAVFCSSLTSWFPVIIIIIIIIIIRHAMGCQILKTHYEVEINYTKDVGTVKKNAKISVCTSRILFNTAGSFP